MPHRTYGHYLVGGKPTLNIGEKDGKVVLDLFPLAWLEFSPAQAEQLVVNITRMIHAARQTVEDHKGQEGEAMSHVGRWEAQDKMALERALLALHTCPRCRADLQPVALFEDSWGCAHCHETWYVPKEG